MSTRRDFADSAVDRGRVRGLRELFRDPRRGKRDRAQSLAFNQKPVGDGVFAAGEWPRADWWSMFGDPKLDSLVERALAGNPSLHAAEARVRAARALADAVRSALYPTVDLNASVARQRFSENDIYPPPFGGGSVELGPDHARLQLRVRLLGQVPRPTRRRARRGARGGRRHGSCAARPRRPPWRNLFSSRPTSPRSRSRRTRRSPSARACASSIASASRGLETAIPVRQSDQQVGLVAGRGVGCRSRRTARPASARGAGRPGPGRCTGHPAGAPHVRRSACLARERACKLLARRPDIVAQQLRVEATAARIGAAKADLFPNINLAAFVGLGAADIHGLPLFNAGSAIAGIGPALRTCQSLTPGACRPTCAAATPNTTSPCRSTTRRSSTRYGRSPTRSRASAP